MRSFHRELDRWTPAQRKKHRTRERRIEKSGRDPKYRGVYWWSACRYAPPPFQVCDRSEMRLGCTEDLEIGEERSEHECDRRAVQSRVMLSGMMRAKVQKPAVLPSTSLSYCNWRGRYDSGYYECRKLFVPESQGGRKTRIPQLLEKSLVLLEAPVRLLNIIQHDTKALTYLDGDVCIVNAKRSV